MIFLELAEQVLAQRERDGVRGLDRELSRFRCHIQTANFAGKDIAAIGAAKETAAAFAKLAPPPSDTVPDLATAAE